MTKKYFHKSITTDVSAGEAFKKICKVGDWWLTSFSGKAEWKYTTVVFELSDWTLYIGKSLPKFLKTGKGEPYDGS